MQMYKISCQ